MKKIIILCLMSVLFGCSPILPNIDDDFKVGSDSDGIIIFSTRHRVTCSPTDLFGIMKPFGNLGFSAENKFKGTSILYNSNLDSDYSGIPGLLHAKKMAPGTYVFDRVSTYLNVFHKLGESILSLPFTLKPGQIIYVGEVMVTVSNCTYDDGENTYKAQFDYQVSDQWQRDKLIVKKKYKNIDINTVKLNITSI